MSVKRRSRASSRLGVKVMIVRGLPIAIGLVVAAGAFWSPASAGVVVLTSHAKGKVALSLIQPGRLIHTCELCGANPFDYPDPTTSPNWNAMRARRARIHGTGCLGIIGRRATTRPRLLPPQANFPSVPTPPTAPPPKILHACRKHTIGRAPAFRRVGHRMVARSYAPHSPYGNPRRYN